MSPFKDITAGVPQGTVLGPILWNLFISDLNPSAYHVKCADDITLYHPTKKWDCEVYQALDYTSKYCKENNLIINVKKSKALNFTLQKSICMSPLCIADGNLFHQPEVKLLGEISTNTMNLTPSLNGNRKDKACPHAIVKLKRSGVIPSALALFYRARILSVLSYSAPCWYPHVSDMAKLNMKVIKNIVRESYFTLTKTMTIDCFPNATSTFRFYVSILFWKYKLMKITNAINSSLTSII